MAKNIIFKILGILGGLAIILSVFLPYTANSLWYNYTSVNKQIYMPIIIIFFGFLPLLLNLIGKKEEFSYTSVGALTFFLIINSVDFISSGNFSALSVGFYILIVGILLVFISTILIDKNSKINVLNEQIAPITNNMSNPIERKEIDSIYGEIGSENPQIVSDSNPLIDESNSSAVEEISSDIVDPLGEEIPDYDPENAVNPVISEFTSSNSDLQTAVGEIAQQQEAAQAPVEEIAPQQEVVQAPVEEVAPQEEAVQAPVEEVAPQQEAVQTPVGEVAPQQEAVQAPVGEIAPQQEIVQTPVGEVAPQQEAVQAPVGEIAPQQEVVQAPVGEIAPQQEAVQAPMETTSQFITQQEPVQEVIFEEPKEPQFDIFGQPK